MHLLIVFCRAIESGRLRSIVFASIVLDKPAIRWLSNTPPTARLLQKRTSQHLLNNETRSRFRLGIYFDQVLPYHSHAKQLYPA